MVGLVLALLIVACNVYFVGNDVGTAINLATYFAFWWYVVWSIISFVFMGFVSLAGLVVSADETKGQKVQDAGTELFVQSLLTMLKIVIFNILFITSVSLIYRAVPVNSNYTDWDMVTFVVGSVIWLVSALIFSRRQPTKEIK